MPTKENTQILIKKYERSKNSSGSSSDKKSFGRDVAKLASGTIIAQAIGFLSTPIITRLFGTSVYGVFAVFTSIISILTAISCFRYEQAILLPENDKDAGSVFFVSVFFVILLSAITFPIFLLFGDRISSFLNTPELHAWLVFVPLVLLIDGIYLAIRMWNTRRKRYGTQAIAQSLQSLSTAGFNIGFGGLGWNSVSALIVTNIIGKSIGLIILGMQTIKRDLMILVSSFSLNNIKQMIRRYKKFPLIDVWSALMHSVSWQIPVLMLTGFFSASVAGLYSLGHMVIQTPLSLIGGSIQQVYMQRASIAKRDGTIGIITEEIVEIMLFIVVVPLMILMVLGGDLFALVFGNDWFEAGVYVQILAIWAIVWFVTNPIGGATSILEIQGIRFLYTLGNIVTRFISLIIGGIFQNVYLAMFLFAISGIITYGFLLVSILKHTRASISRILFKTRKTIIFTFIFIVSLAIVYYILNLNFIIVLGIAIITIILYYIVLIKTNKKIRDYLPI